MMPAVSTLRTRLLNVSETINAAVRTDSDAMGPRQLGIRGRAAVSAVTFFSRSGKGGDDALGINLADPVVARVRNVDGAVHIDSKPLGFKEPGIDGQATVSETAGAGNRTYGHFNGNYIE